MVGAKEQWLNWDVCMFRLLGAKGIWVFLMYWEWAMQENKLLGIEGPAEKNCLGVLWIPPEKLENPELKRKPMIECFTLDIGSLRWERAWNIRQTQRAWSWLKLYDQSRTSTYSPLQSQTGLKSKLASWRAWGKRRNPAHPFSQKWEVHLKLVLADGEEKVNSKSSLESLLFGTRGANHWIEV